MLLQPRTEEKHFENPVHEKREPERHGTPYGTHFNLSDGTHKKRVRIRRGKHIDIMGTSERTPSLE